MRSKLGYCNITGDLCEDIPVKWCKRLGEAYRQGFSSGIKFYSDIQEEELELDLDWCYYLAINILGLSEEEFLRSTPKKLFKLAEIHQKVNNPNPEKDSKPKEEEVYIDQLI